MDKYYESKYHRLEENYWWFVARRDFVLNLIKKVGLDNYSRILEIGCAGGILIKYLQQNGFMNIQGIDISDDAINLCKKRGVNNVAIMNGAETQFEDEKFDAIIASDVLEHMGDDRSALLEWYRLLKPNGMLILFVPAFFFLWSSHDETNRHYRRYNRLTLTKILKESHFKLLRISYWNFFLFFPIYLVRTFQYFFIQKTSKSKNQLYELHPCINSILIALLKAENFLLKHMSFPVGVSIFAVCKK